MLHERLLALRQRLLKQKYRKYFRIRVPGKRRSDMKKYDVIVIGSGCGMGIVSEALAHGLSTALVDKGPLGGTCPNLGCIPSKMLIFTADRIAEIQAAKKLGIEAEIRNIDFNFIMERMRQSIHENQAQMRHGLSHAENLDFFEGEGHFTGEHTIEIKGEEIRGDKIFIASGSRPFIPPIKGLDSVEYLTNETVLQLMERPYSLTIIGGGYFSQKRDRVRRTEAQNLSDA